MIRAFQERYGCAADFDRFQIAEPLAPERGYFRFGDTGLLFGCTAPGLSHPDPRSAAASAPLQATRLPGGWSLPFDPDDTALAMRTEAHHTRGGDAGGPGGPGLLRRGYYAVRPWLPVGVRRHAQRFWMRDWKSLPFPRWPVDSSVDEMMEDLLALASQDAPGGRAPVVPFWPDGHRACLILTHDVETAAGRDWVPALMDLDAAHGFRSSFELIPERRYEVPAGLLDEIRARGFEVNLHGLYHDGRLFDEHGEFLRRAARINEIARAWGARGFRAPVAYRRLDWFGALDAFDYDMSVPNSGRLEAQRGGCCTVFPWFLGHLVELPLTTVQDYALINILGTPTLDIWKEQVAAIIARGGLISFVLHPDYVQSGAGRRLLDQFLPWMRGVCDRERVWCALPRDAADWWRHRAGLSHGQGMARSRAAHGEAPGARCDPSLFSP